MSKTPDSSNQRMKRFYDKARVEADKGVYWILLDDKPIQTPAKTPLEVPSEKLAKAIAGEWADQGEWIEPGAMFITKLANSAIDHVDANRDAVVEDIVKYASSDLICYLAEEPQELMMRQMAQWGPVIDWLAQSLGARFEVAMGVNHVEQSPESLERVRLAIKDFDKFSLTALHTMTSLTGSALLSLANIAGLFELITIWQAAHLDEDWQMAKWGVEEGAKERRERRWQEMQAADKVFKFMLESTP